MEEVRFELTSHCCESVFETDAFGHSATLPGGEGQMLYLTDSGLFAIAASNVRETFVIIAASWAIAEKSSAV